MSVSFNEFQTKV